MNDQTVGTPTNQPAKTVPMNSYVYPAQELGPLGLDHSKHAIFEVVRPLNEYERVAPEHMTSFHQWPESVRNDITRILDRWRETHPGITETGHAVHTGTMKSYFNATDVPACVLQVFWTGPGAPKNTYTAEAIPEGQNHAV